VFRNRLTLLIIIYVLILFAAVWAYEAHRLRQALQEEEGKRLDQWAQVQEQWLNNQLDSGGSAALYQFVSGARDALNAYALFVTEADGKVLLRRDSAEVPLPLDLGPERLLALGQGEGYRLLSISTAKGGMISFTRALERKGGESPRILEIDLPLEALDGPYQAALKRQTQDLAVVALLAAGGLWLILAWNVLLPVRRISRRLQGAVEGEGADLLVEFPAAGSSELVALAKALNTFFSRTRDLASTVREQAYRLGEQVEELRQSVEGTHEASQALGTGAQQLAEGLSEEATLAEDVNLMTKAGEVGMREVLERALLMENRRLAGLAEEQIGRMARIQADMQRLAALQGRGAGLAEAVASHGQAQTAAVEGMRQAFSGMAAKSKLIIQKAASFRFGQ
jgi:methyl-accepting chemotaxis protein